MLELFAYGRYSDYRKRHEALQPATLTEKQARKLKQLSIVALAHESRVIPYSVLLAELELATLRELEDVVIDAIYRDLLVAKLDHASSQLEVAHAIGRDVRLSDVAAMVRTVSAWTTRAEELLRALEQQAQRAKATASEHAQHEQLLQTRLEEMRAAVKTSIEADSESAMQLQMQGGGMMANMMGMMGMMGDDRGQKKKDAKAGKGGQHARHMH